MCAFGSMFNQRVWNKEVSVWFQFNLIVKFTESVGLGVLTMGGEMHIQNAKICEPWNQRRRSAFG